MPSLYKFAKVCVSASWFETTGLTSIEAMFCGTNAVACGDRAREYLGDLVSYCRPDDINSIKTAIHSEFLAPRPAISAEMKHNFSWKTAARETLDVYESLLKK
jgi:glycosyltransferase involved in cell wall biosynthesis